MDITEELIAEARFRASTNQHQVAGLLMKAAEEIVRLREEVTFKVRTNAPDTSKAVSKKIREGTLQETMMKFFQHSKIGEGWTDDDLERALLRSHQSVSAARNTLVRKGYITDSGQRRKTRSGNPAIVWRLK